MIANTLGMYRPLAFLTDLIGYQGYANLVVQTVRQTPWKVSSGMALAPYPSLTFLLFKTTNVRPAHSMQLTTCSSGASGKMAHLWKPRGDNHQMPS